MIRLAVIADPHHHDTGWVPVGTGLPGAIRSYADTAASTRVFNESGPAFRAALDRAVSEGARHLLLVGDLTDDGQAPNISSAIALLDEYRRRHGLRVFSTPGNHDFFAVHGRAQTKTFLDADGRRATVSSADAPDAATLGAADALTRMSSLGFFPDPADLHWETPYGRDPDLASRSHVVASPGGRTSCRIVDASYLVEPVDGLWILSLDANVAVPRDEATDLRDEAGFHDPTGHGWNAVLARRAHLLDWMADVVRRARAGGKSLVTFSHYPVLDPLAGASAAELRLFETSGLARRAPAPAVAAAVAATGVGVHFSGHLHVNDTAWYGEGPERLVNVAVPSPVGFPPAMKFVDVHPDRLEVRTVRLDRVPGHDLAYAAYRAEAERAGEPPPRAAEAPDHGAFIDRHLADLVAARYVPREWPEPMAAFVRGRRASDLVDLLGVGPLAAPDLPLEDLVVDWYRLRKGGELALDVIPPARIAFYRALLAALPADPGTGLRSDFVRFLRILGTYVDRPANRDFTVPLARRRADRVVGA